MPLKRTIFEHDTEPKQFWVQTRVVLSPTTIKHITLRLTQVWNDSGPISGSFEITDFRAPNHPEIDWDWLDRHAKQVWAAVEFSS
jgi:hypothetical protein